MRTSGIVFLFLIVSLPAKAQFFKPADSLDTRRVWLVASVGAVGYTASMVGLYHLWYKDYDLDGFRFYNDNDQWLQMDKAGHALTSYQLGRYASESMQWAGINDRLSTWAGGSFGLLYLISVEIFDGKSTEWGFSPGDMLANVGGTTLFVGQQLAWNEQRMSLKFSYTHSDIAPYRPKTLGAGNLERALKDYNGQTIWLSVNPSSFLKKENTILPWLNIAFGYGGNGMLGGSGNPAFDEAGDRYPVFERNRQFYISADVDLNRIKTNSHLLQTVFSVIGFVKIPAPAVEFSRGDLTWHWFHF